MDQTRCKRLSKYGRPHVVLLGVADNEIKPLTSSTSLMLLNALTVTQR